MSSHNLPISTAKYKTLDQEGEFRLLTLLPGRKGSRIECLLAHANIGTSPPYEALSYTWGDPKTSRNTHPSSPNADRAYSIRLGDGRAHIKYNFEAALQHLRSETQPRTLWIDALCIDQNNNKERSNQVQMMAKIYVRASRVLCWLGESDESAFSAFDAFEELCWAAKVCIWRDCAEQLGLPLQEITFDILQSAIAATPPLSGEDGLTVFYMLKLQLIPPLALKRTLSAIPTTFSTTDLAKLASARFGESAFIARSLVSGTGNLSSFSEFSAMIQAIDDTFQNRSYWQRLWIVQECLLANEAVLICGDRHFDLDMMQLIWLITGYVRSGRPGRPGRPNLLTKKCDEFAVSEFICCLSKLSLIFNRRYSKEMPTLFESVFEIDDRFCSEPRDRIYALLGISSPAGILVEYDKPIPVVFAEATRAMICQSQSIDVLCMTPAYGSGATNDIGGVKFPSWVPHFEVHLGSFGFFSAYRGRSRYKKNWPLSDMECRYPANDLRVLRIDGFFYSAITSTSLRVISFQNAWERAMDLQLQLLPVGSSPSQTSAFWRTLLMDLYQGSRKGFDRIGMDKEAEKNLDSDLAEMFESNKGPDRLMSTISETMENKTICRTSKTNLAHACGDVEAGDFIFVALGATIPLIIQPTSNDESFNDTKKSLEILTFYKFVGGAYVHGIMDGELSRIMDDADFVPETIYLI